MDRITRTILVILLLFAFSVDQSIMAQIKGEKQHSISHNQNPPTGSYGQIPIQHNSRAVTITESNSQNIVTGNSVACNAGGLHTDNSYFRSFVLNDFGISSDFYISNISIGVEQAVGAGGTQPITCNLYTTSQPFPGGYPASLTLIGTTDIQIPDQALTIFDIPFSPTALAPAGSELVVEIFTPNGQTAGNSFFIGSNGDGETAPSYLMAVDCGVTVPTPTGSIGFPTMMIVFNVTGDFTPVGPGPATDPNPADAAVDVDINADLSWTNPGAATSVEVLFGTTPGSLTSIYSGAPIATIDPGTMDYMTDYYWKVNETDGTGTTFGTTWHFTTVQNPNLQVLFFDDFENGTGQWTITNDGGTCVWEIFFPPYPNTYTMPCGTGCNGVFAADVDECGSGSSILSSAMITNPLDATGVTSLSLEFDNDFNAISASDEGYVEVSTDGGTTWTAVWSSIGIDITNTHEIVDLSAYEGTIFTLRFRSVQPAWDWWWVVDNVKIQGAGGGPTNIFTDNFDAYTAGGQLACQSTNWTTWNLTPCDPTTDPYISNNYSWSPDNTVVIAFNNDLVHIFDAAGPKTSGTWYASFLAYIPTGKSGYFNTLAVFDGGISPSWAMEVYFDQGGAGRLLNGSTVAFTWPEATWFQVIVKVDLDNDQGEFMLGTDDPLQSIATWQWTRGGTIPLSVDANDLFGATANDEMYVDNYYFGDVMPAIIPVEFSAFTANASNGNVVLNWATATETNNRGFEVQRNSGNGYQVVGFVQGSGTSTQTQNYTFTDKSVAEGSYSYRLRQIDFDGTSAYSQVVEVKVEMPKVFALEQNYPNPFNPTTQINFSLAADSKVNLKVFNILGQEVTTLFAGDMAAGSHFINFNASNLSSGVYIYKLEANGVNGSRFSAVKKMVLTK